MIRYICTIIISLFLMSCSGGRGDVASLQSSLEDFIRDKDARIGVAVIINGTDTVAVNGDEQFPMLSVYKFPIALALAEQYRTKGLSLDRPVAILPQDLHTDTYSPMTEKIIASSQLSTDTLQISTKELVGYMLQLSDNNASDIALREANGTVEVDRYLKQLGIKDVHVRNSEDEMHKDNSLCYANSSTPLAMARLMDKFDRDFNDSISLDIKQLMETCATGTERLAKPVLEANAVLGHKTGTGFKLPDGRIMAVNDAGYVHLPDGSHYCIAVFIENSGYDMAQTEAIIAGISQIVIEYTLRVCFKNKL